jgi:hypothetical protein
MVLTTPFLPNEVWLHIIAHLNAEPELLWRMRTISSSMQALIEFYFHSHWIRTHTKLFSTNWRGWIGNFSHFSDSGAIAYFRVANRKMHWWKSSENLRYESAIRLYVMIVHDIDGSANGKRMKLCDTTRRGEGNLYDLGKMYLEEIEVSGSKKKILGFDWQEMMELWVALAPRVRCSEREVRDEEAEVLAV